MASHWSVPKLACFFVRVVRYQTEWHPDDEGARSACENLSHINNTEVQMAYLKIIGKLSAPVVCIR